MNLPGDYMKAYGAGAWADCPARQGDLYLS